MGPTASRAGPRCKPVRGRAAGRLAESLASQAAPTSTTASADTVAWTNKAPAGKAVAPSRAARANSRSASTSSAGTAAQVPGRTQPAKDRTACSNPTRPPRRSTPAHAVRRVETGLALVPSSVCRSANSGWSSAAPFDFGTLSGPTRERRRTASALFGSESARTRWSPTGRFVRLDPAQSVCLAGPGRLSRRAHRTTRMHRWYLSSDVEGKCQQLGLRGQALSWSSWSGGNAFVAVAGFAVFAEGTRRSGCVGFSSRRATTSRGSRGCPSGPSVSVRASFRLVTRTRLGAFPCRGGRSPNRRLRLPASPLRPKRLAGIIGVLTPKRRKGHGRPSAEPWTSRPGAAACRLTRRAAPPRKRSVHSFSHQL